MAARRGCRPPSGISSNRRVINEIPGGRTNTGARQARFCSLGKKKSKLAIFLMIRPRRQRLQTLYPNLGYPTSGTRPGGQYTTLHNGANSNFTNGLYAYCRHRRTPTLIPRGGTSKPPYSVLFCCVCCSFTITFSVSESATW